MLSVLQRSSVLILPTIVVLRSTLVLPLNRHRGMYECTWSCTWTRGFLQRGPLAWMRVAWVREARHSSPGIFRSLGPTPVYFRPMTGRIGSRPSCSGQVAVGLTWAELPQVAFQFGN